jgi:hypothetical protein
MILYSHAPGHKQEQNHRINISDHFRCKKNLTSGCRVPELMPLFRFPIVEVMIVHQQSTWHSRSNGASSAVAGRTVPTPHRTGPNKEHTSKLLHRLPFPAALVATAPALLEWLVGIEEGRYEWEGASRAMMRLLDLSLPASQKRCCANSECYEWSPVVVILTV